MERFKTGFDKDGFERDHFTFKRGSGQKFFHGWEDVRYEGGLSPMLVNTRELEDGNMSKPLYDFLEHVYGAEEMAGYFPAPEPEQQRRPTLHFSPTSIMANGVGKNPVNPARPVGHQGSAVKIMSDDEIDELATLLCGSHRDVVMMQERKGKK